MYPIHLSCTCQNGYDSTFYMTFHHDENLRGDSDTAPLPHCVRAQALGQAWSAQCPAAPCPHGAASGRGLTALVLVHSHLLSVTNQLELWGSRRSFVLPSKRLKPGWRGKVLMKAERTVGLQTSCNGLKVPCCSENRDIWEGETS